MTEKERPTEKDLVPGYKCIVVCIGYLGGRPALLGKRMSVQQILENLANGMTREEFQDLFEIEPSTIDEVLNFAAEFAGGVDAVSNRRKSA